VWLGDNLSALGSVLAVFAMAVAYGVFTIARRYVDRLNGVMALSRRHGIN